jgi:hypothetical protein
MDGLRRGGFAGLAETTAGGALIGYKFGGPLGAAIGGIAGAVAGIVRLFVKGAADKAKEKIKALYGVDIADKGVLKQIVDMTKSEFGGNIDMAIRSPQIRDLIQLYAMTTGQKTTGMPGTVTPLSLVETGGSLRHQPEVFTRSDRRGHRWPIHRPVQRRLAAVLRPRKVRRSDRTAGTRIAQISKEDHRHGYRQDHSRMRRSRQRLPRRQAGCTAGGCLRGLLGAECGDRGHGGARGIDHGLPHRFRRQPDRNRDINVSAGKGARILHLQPD